MQANVVLILENKILSAPSLKQRSECSLPKGYRCLVPGTVVAVAPFSCANPCCGMVMVMVLIANFAP